MSGLRVVLKAAVRMLRAVAVKEAAAHNNMRAIRFLDLARRIEAVTCEV